MLHGDHPPRPGGTIPGPSMFALADAVLYAAVLVSAGPITRAAPPNLNIDFLKRPTPPGVIGEARIPKPGKRLAVGEIALHSGGETELAAHATAPQSRGAPQGACFAGGARLQNCFVYPLWF
jgi:acyl-coenzyme A thioesterase PaaI-like protein